jgi:hypothetical protein
MQMAPDRCPPPGCRHFEAVIRGSALLDSYRGVDRLNCGNTPGGRSGPPSQGRCHRLEPGCTDDKSAGRQHNSL